MPKGRAETKRPETLVRVVGVVDAEERGLFDRRVVRDVIDVDRLGEEVKAFTAAMERILGSLAKEIAGYRVDSVSLTAEVSAKGRLSLLGSGGELGGKGGITFTFKRAPS
jgi:hypothetical protein